MAKRFVVRIELSPAAKRMLSNVSQKNGMTQVAVMSRLMKWFHAQPDTIQAAVLGRYPSDYPGDIAKLILRRMAGEA
jgi:hypothetical protein